MYRLAERFGKKPPASFLAAMPNGAELTGLFAYLRVDDEVQVQRMTYAIAKAFGGSLKQSARTMEDDEEIIDTTKPEFAKAFKGFINVPGQRN